MPTITSEQYQQAIEQKESAEKLIQQFHREKADEFQQRLESGAPFTDEELVYSAHSLCPCGHGLAYPKGCGPGHYWDCSAILKGIQDNSVEHTGQLPFAFYKVDSEGERRGSVATTRGVFRPKPKSGEG